MSLSVSARLSTATRSGHAGQRAHDLRQGVIPGYVDRSCIPQNRVVIAPPASDSMTETALERRRARYDRGDLARYPRSIRRDAAIALEGILTFGTDSQPIIERLPYDEQERRYRAAAEAIAEQLGTDVAGLVIHRDESAPHCHFTLHGYSPDGMPAASRLNKGQLSKVQDVAAQAFGDLGIERGKRIGARIADGEDPSAYINKSVAELHRDLPAEVEAARQKAGAEREKAEKAEQRREAAQAKAAAADGQVEKLEKRIATYERRAETAEKRAREAEAEAARLQKRLEALADADQNKPKTRRAPVPQVEERGWGPFSWQKVTGTQNVVYLHPADAKKWRGAVLKRERDARDDAARQRQESERLEKQRQQELKRRQQLQNALIHTMTAPAAFDDAEAALWAAEAVLIERYGVQMQVAAEIARVPPQKSLTDRQIAAALYREGRDQGWEQQWFSVPNGVAREIIEMARDDDRLDRIRFRDDDKATELLEEAREESAERARMRAQEADPDFDPLGDSPPPQPKPRSGPSFGR